MKESASAGRSMWILFSLWAAAVSLILPRRLLTAWQTNGTFGVTIRVVCQNLCIVHDCAHQCFCERIRQPHVSAVCKITLHGMHQDVRSGEAGPGMYTVTAWNGSVNLLKMSWGYPAAACNFCPGVRQVDKACIGHGNIAVFPQVFHGNADAGLFKAKLAGNVYRTDNRA